MSDKNNTEMSDEEVIEKLWEEIREGYKDLFEDLPTVMPCNSPVMKKDLPLLTQQIKVGLKYRTANLAKTAIELFKEDELLPALIITRSIVETISLLFWLHRRLENIVKTGEFGDIDDFLGRMAFGDKSGGPERKQYGNSFEALNVLSGIDKLSKRYGDVLKISYDHLSGFAHPNYYGALGYFSQLKKGQGCLEFSSDATHENLFTAKETGLTALASSLQLFFIHEQEIYKLLPEFQKICDEEGLSDAQKNFEN